jgi:hypothetical protein
MTGRKYPMSERVGIVPPRAPECRPSRNQENRTMSSTSAPNRRSFFGRGAAIAAVPAVATLAVGARAEPASADTLPDYAPIPPSALRPAVNAQGYYVGRVEKNLYWVTDATHQAAFLTTGRGRALLRTPTIGHKPSARHRRGRVGQRRVQAGDDLRPAGG